MSDYAADLAARWTADSSTRSEREAIEGAIREALAKAAEVASDGLDGRSRRRSRNRYLPSGSAKRWSNSSGPTSST